ncbi:enolase C-terminal domain-like protein [Dipodascopsis tothii]|uniref:enolase C-terminal domain-like protein n=1 Tax=Dipodascopsis tothii TaxID=44089 RepID=UPI0034CD13DE
MPKITDIEYFRVPPRWLYVKITADDGSSGWGEASLEGHSEAVEGALEEFKQRFIGEEANGIEHIWQSVWRMGFYRGGPVFQSALSGIDIALWDMKARRLGVPIYELLGGKVRNKIKVYAWIGGDRPDSVKAQAEARKAQGFTAVKMNATADIGWLDTPSSLDSAAERLAMVKSVGMDAGVDFHGRIHKPMAKQLAKLLEPHRPMFIEEPLLSEHPEGIEELSKLTSIPIALGERLYSRWDVKKFLSTHGACIDILQPDIAHVGGISETHKIATMCEAYDVAIAPHCPLGSIALAANFQIAACTPNHVIQEMSLGIHYNTESGDEDIGTYVHNPDVFDVQDGYVSVPSGPGLGIEINEALVRKLSNGAKAWRSGGFVGPDGSLREW